MSKFLKNELNEKKVTETIFKLHSKNDRIFTLSSFNNFLLGREKISFESYKKNYHRTKEKIAFNKGQISSLKEVRILLIAS